MSGGYQPQGFQQPGFQQNAEIVAEIIQALPALTQALTAEVEGAAPEAPSPGGGVFLGPGFMRQVVRVKIDQDLPALTQLVIVDVNDDADVLLMLLV